MIGSRATVALMRLKEIDKKYKVRGSNDQKEEDNRSSENTESLIEASAPKKNYRVSTIPEKREILKSTLNIKIPNAYGEELESRSLTSENNVSTRVTTVQETSGIRETETSRSTTGSEKSRSTHGSERSLPSMEIKESRVTNVSEKPLSVIQSEKSHSETEIDEVLDEENSIAEILDCSNISGFNSSERFDDRCASSPIMPVRQSMTKKQSKSLNSSADSIRSGRYSDDSFESSTSEKQSSTHSPNNETASQSVPENAGSTEEKDVSLLSVHSTVSDTRRTVDNELPESGKDIDISDLSGIMKSDVKSNRSTKSRKMLKIRDRGLDREGLSQSLKHRRSKFMALHPSPKETMSSTKDEYNEGAESVEHSKSASSQRTKPESLKRKTVPVKINKGPSYNETSSNSQISLDPTDEKLDVEEKSETLQNCGKSVVSERSASSSRNPTRSALDLNSCETKSSVTADRTRNTEKLFDFQKFVASEHSASDMSKNSPLNLSYDVKQLEEHKRSISENSDRSEVGEDRKVIYSQSDPSSRICQSKLEADISSTRGKKLEAELSTNVRGTDQRAQSTLEITRRNDSFLDNKKVISSKKRSQGREQHKNETTKACRSSTSYRPSRKIKHQDYCDRELRHLQKRKNDLLMEQQRELMLRYSRIFEEDEKRLLLWPDRLNCSGMPKMSVIQPLDFPSVANFTEPDKRLKEDTVISDIRLEMMKNRIVEIRRWLKDQFVLYREYCDVAAAVNAKYVIDERISRKASRSAQSRARRDSPEVRGCR